MTAGMGIAVPHNPKVVGSNRTPATMNDVGLADATVASPFVYPDFTQTSGVRLLLDLLALIDNAAGSR